MKQDNFSNLTDREIQVLRLIAGGRSNNEIAQELIITSNTVANHVKNILFKTAAANRTEAAMLALDVQRFLDRPAAPITAPNAVAAPPGAPIGDPGMRWLIGTPAMDWLGSMEPWCTWDGLNWEFNR